MGRSCGPVGTFPCPAPSDRLRDVHLTPAMLVSLSAESSVRNTRTELGKRRRSRHENEIRKGRWKDRC